MAHARIIAGRSMAIVGTAIALTGFAISELAPRFIARDIRHVVAEVAVYFGLTLTIVGLVLCAERKRARS